MKIHLIRHGRSQANEKGIYADLKTPLSAAGIEELKGRQFAKPEILFTSPAERARETARILFGEEGQIREDLLEISYGKFEGLSFQEAEKTYPQACKAWLDSPYKQGPPGGESIDQLLRRAGGLLEDLKRLDEDLVCVTHEGLIRGLLALVLDQPSAYFKFKIENGAMTTIEVLGSFSQILQINYK